MLSNWLQRLPRNNFKGTATGTSGHYRINSSNSLYFLSKSKDAAGNLSASSNTVNVTTTGNTVTYCASKGIM
jgi:hypothetical protein